MRIFVSALEPSSNLHLEFLLRELIKSVEKIDLCGVFYPYLSTSKPLYLPEQFSTMGFVDIFKKIRFFIKAKKRMLSCAMESDKILLMDSSSFNIPLAKEIKKINPNKEIMYYILPQIWAWKPWRAKIIEQYCDKLAAILPFEISYYKSKARYVGHPLLDEITKFRILDSFNSSCDVYNKIITFMPGSRIGEINRIFPIFVEVKNILKNIESNLVFNLVVPKHFINKDLSKIYGDYSDFNVVFNVIDSLSNSAFAFICSGTATLECAIIGTPFVLCYKAKLIDFLIVKYLLNIKHIGLANIISNKIDNKLFHRELLQDDLNVNNLIHAYNTTHCNIKSFIDNSIKIRKYLKCGSAKIVADWLLI